MFAIHTAPSKAVKLLRRTITAKYGNILLLITLLTFALLAFRLLICDYLPRTLRRPLPLWFVLSICTGVVVALSFLETQDDYLFLTKRLGRISAAILPGLIFLSLKPSPIYRETYLRLLPLHIWIGRLLVIVSTAHAILYVNYWIQIGELRKILEFENFLGVVLITAFISTFVVSFHFVRSRNHELFFRTHYIFAWLTVLIIAIHARPRIYLISVVLILLLGSQLYFRYGCSKTCRLHVRRISSTTQMITLPRSTFPKYFPPGAHIRISPSRSTSRYWFLSASHPYTIASLASDEDSVRLIVKPTRRFHLSEEHEYVINGPYPSLGYDFFLNMYKNDYQRKVIVITGGVGISFAAPIVTSLRRMNERVKLLWAVRSLDDIVLLKTLDLSDVTIYFASDESPDIDDEFLLRDVGDRGDGRSLKPDVPLADSELGMGSSLMAGDEETLTRDENFMQERNIMINNKRLNIEFELKEFRNAIDTTGDYGMWLISCGSRSLVGECSKWGRKLGATVHEEVYDI